MITAAAAASGTPANQNLLAIALSCPMVNAGIQVGTVTAARCPAASGAIRRTATSPAPAGATDLSPSRHLRPNVRTTAADITTSEQTAYQWLVTRRTAAIATTTVRRRPLSPSDHAKSAAQRTQS